MNMKRIRRVIKDRTGTGYIDVVVMVLVVMMLLALSIKVLPIFITKIHKDLCSSSSKTFRPICYEI